MDIRSLYCVTALIFFLPSGQAHGQAEGDSAARFVFLPDGLHIAPLKAGLEEPRIGVYRFFTAANMKVDIGNSIDVFGLEMPDNKTLFTVGIDFFAYAYVTDAQGLRLQIDALDGYFGGNLSGSRELSDGVLQARLRILHHSAHFADGHYSNSLGGWSGNRSPIPFTQDFGELMCARVFSSPSKIVRLYGGVSYASLVRPSSIRRYSYRAGCEYALPSIVGSVVGHPTNPFVAYEMSWEGTPSYIPSHQVQAGIKFGEWYRKGVTMYLAYYTGRQMFAEYFDERQETFGLGFTVDFY